MPQRIKPTDVTAAFRAAVAAADIIGVDTTDWTLCLSDSNYSIVTRPKGGGMHKVEHLGTGGRAAFDALHAMRAAWNLVPYGGQPGTWPCWHVEATNGMVYGVAATTKVGAFAMLNARLAADSEQHHAVKAENVGTWETPYATTLCYGEGKIA